MSEVQIQASTPAAIVPADFKANVLKMFDENFGPYVREKLAFYEECKQTAALVTVTDPASLALADDLLKAMLVEADSLEKVRLSGPGAINSLGRELGKRFKPLVDSLDVSIANLKRVSGDYLTAERRKQAESYQAAAALHVAGNHAEAQAALEVASAANTMAPKGTTVGESWEVERYEPSLMVLSTPTHPGLAPDEQAIGAYLRKLPPGETPNLPGVICKLVSSVTARRPRE